MLWRNLSLRTVISNKSSFYNEIRQNEVGIKIYIFLYVLNNGEKEGNPYWFINSNEFYKMMDNNEFIEYRKYNTLLNNNPATWYYGVAKSAIKDNLKYVAVLDVQGMKDFKSHFGDRVKTFYINVDSETRRKRAIVRGSFDETEWDRRLEDDEKVFVDKSIFDYIIDNNSDNIETAYANILKHIAL